MSRIPIQPQPGVVAAFFCESYVMTDIETEASCMFALCRLQRPSCRLHFCPIGNLLIGIPWQDGGLQLETEAIQPKTEKSICTKGPKREAAGISLRRHCPRP